MKDAGARGPAVPPKPPAKPVSPPTPPVAPAKPIAAPIAPRVGPAVATPKPANATPSPAHAKVAPAPATPMPAKTEARADATAKMPVVEDDGWDEQPTAIEDAKIAPAAIVPPVQPVAVPKGIEEALAPVLSALRDLERRVAELEARPAPAPPAFAAPKGDPFAAALARPAAPAAAAPVIAAVAPAAMAAPVVAAASAAVAAPIAAPVATAPAASRAPWVQPGGGPTLDLAAIERDNSIAIDMPFDGAKRRRRLKMGCAFVMIVSLGGLLAVLISSYMR